MVGLGEEQDELVDVLADLRTVGVAILTIGQYLRPSTDHAPMTRYYHPDEFKELKRIALGLGFAHVEAVRWSGVRTTLTSRPTPRARRCALGSGRDAAVMPTPDRARVLCGPGRMPATQRSRACRT